MITPLNGVVYSDIHGGHRKTPTPKIYGDLKASILSDIKEFKPKVLMIAGDLFDRHLPLNSEEATESGFFIGWLLTICKKHNIILRLLEGTPSHDWKQGWMLDAINNNQYLNSNAKWVNELSIEYIQEIDANVLYIPDEWGSSTEDTKYQVIELLEKHDLKKVDIVLMHGMFPHQIPEHVNAPVHDHDFYQKITEYNIFCGHVHKFSQLGKLVVPGSHNRLAHGEEDPKGHIRFSYTKKNRNITFVENKAAMVYKTIDVTGLDIDAVLNKIDADTKDIEFGSYIRLRCKSTDPANVKSKNIRAEYPSFNWSMDVDNTENKLVECRDDSSIYRTTPITDVTVNNLVKELMLEKNIDGVTVNMCLAALDEVKKWMHQKEK